MQRCLAVTLLAFGFAGCGGGAAGTSGASATVPVMPTNAPLSVNVPVPVPTAGTSGSGNTASTVVATGAANATPNPAATPLVPTASGSYGDQFASLPYVMYVSSKAKRPFPLVLALHGCLEHPADFEAGTRWFEDAEANGYAVVMPAHDATPALNPNGCWEYWSEHYRDRGQAATLAGLVRSVQQLDGADPRRTYVVGMSSGAAQAVALAATYPDVFAAVGSASGTEYQPCVTDDVYQCYVALTTQAADQAPVASGKAAYAQAPSWTHAVPAMLFQGDADTVVAPFNLPQALASLATMDDGFTSGGRFPGTITTAPSAPASGNVPGGHAYDEYTAANGALDWIVVHGMNHAWSGGVAGAASSASDGKNYNDPLGPNATARFRAFFFAHAL